MENVLDTMWTIELPNPGEDGPFNLRRAAYLDRRIVDEPYVWPRTNPAGNPNVVR